jgi:hypothetical protein
LIVSQGHLQTNNLDAFNSIDVSLTSKYLKDKSGYDVFGHVKPSERANLLKSMASDVHTLVRMFENDDRVSSMQSFYCLQRVLKEQCVITPSTEDNVAETVELKAPKDVSSDSLQNPSDPGAGFSGHKGKGYQVQICETFQPEDSKKDEPNGSEGVSEVAKEKSAGTDSNSLSLILHVKAESASVHDSEALKPAIDDMKAKGSKPQVILADTAYGSDANVEYAKSQGVNLVSPVPGNITREHDSVTQENSEVSGGDGQQTEESEDATDWLKA